MQRLKNISERVLNSLNPHKKSAGFMKTRIPKIKNKCEFCRKTGTHFSVDIEHDQIVPDEFHNFKKVLSLQIGYCNFPDEIICCPYCGTYYYKKRRIDNEINNCSDEIEFEEITEDRVKELIIFQKNNK